MSVGIYEHEKQAKQRVIIDMCADVDLAEIIEDKGDVDDIVSYEDFIVLARDLCGTKHFNLLEHLAQSLAEAFMRHRRVMAMDIRIIKPDIFEGSTRVGVSMRFVNPEANERLQNKIVTAKGRA